MTKEEKKATKVKPHSRWQLSPTFLKYFLTYFFLIFVFLLSVFLLLNRYINKTIPQFDLVIPSSTSPSPGVAPASLSPAIVEPALKSATPPVPAVGAVLIPLEHEVIQQNERVSNLENTSNLTSQKIHQLVAYELLQNVLEGHIALKTLTLYLQKHQEPWAIEMLTALSPIKKSKTYEQLQQSLVLPSRSLPIWQRIQNIINSLVRIRKLDSSGRGSLKGVQTALQARNIQQALEAFAALPPEEKALFSSWEKMAQARLALEILKQKMLIMFSEN